MFDSYNIKTWDTPEKISYDLYGTTEYYWTILYVNDIFDMYFDWPMSDEELQKYADDNFVDVVPDATNIYTVECMPYVAGQYYINLSATSTVNPEIIIYPDKLQIGMFVDTNIAGDNCRITNIQKVYNQNSNSINYYNITIDKPTHIYNKQIVVGENDNTIFFNFAAAINSYDSIYYYMTENGVIKDLDSASSSDVMYGITKFDKFTIENEKKKRIKVIKPNQIGNFIKMYFSRVI